MGARLLRYTRQDQRMHGGSVKGLTERAHGRETERKGLDDKQAGHGEEDVHARAPERSALVQVSLGRGIRCVYLVSVTSVRVSAVRRKGDPDSRLLQCQRQQRR